VADEEGTSLFLSLGRKDWYAGVGLSVLLQPLSQRMAPARYRTARHGNQRIRANRGDIHAAARRVRRALSAEGAPATPGKGPCPKLFTRAVLNVMRDLFRRPVLAGRGASAGRIRYESSSLM
jgi:hypothetical protein